jgi:hypothetical protein
MPCRSKTRLNDDITLGFLRHNQTSSYVAETLPIFQVLIGNCPFLIGRHRVTNQHPLRAIELRYAERFERRIIGRRCIQYNTRQEHG